MGPWQAVDMGLSLPIQDCVVLGPLPASQWVLRAWTEEADSLARRLGMGSILLGVSASPRPASTFTEPTDPEDSLLCRPGVQPVAQIQHLWLSASAVPAQVHRHYTSTRQGIEGPTALWGMTVLSPPGPCQCPAPLDQRLEIRKALQLPLLQGERTLPGAATRLHKTITVLRGSSL